MTVKLTEKPRKSPLPRPVRRPPPPLRGEARFAAPPTARFVPAKAVGSFVPALTRKAFEKFGFSAATLIMDWAQIVGAETAAMTAPERLNWPRGAAADREDDDTGARRGATLILRVDPARALDVEYRARQILDRINAYFGYRAVDGLRLIQAPLPSWGGGREGRDAAGPRSGAAAPQTPPSRGEGEEALKAALARLERGIRGERTRRA